MLSKLVAAIAVGVFIVGGSHVHAGVDSGDLCKEKKSKAAGKKALDILKALSTDQKKPNAAKLDLAISKAQSKFTKAFMTAETKGRCLTSSDSDAIGTKVDALVVGVLGATGQFVDNGNGTVTDKATGLMWEKKDAAGGIHDFEKYYR